MVVVKPEVQRITLKIICGHDDPIEVTVADTADFAKILRKITTFKNIDPEGVLLSWNSQRLLNKDTPLSVGMSETESVDLFLHNDGGGTGEEEEDGAAKPAKKCLLKVQYPNEEPTEFRVKFTTPFSKVYEAIAAARGISSRSFKLVHDERRLNEQETPKMMEFEEEETLDFFVEQQGGFLFRTTEWLLTSFRGL